MALGEPRVSSETLLGSVTSIGWPVASQSSRHLPRAIVMATEGAAGDNP